MVTGGKTVLREEPALRLADRPDLEDLTLIIQRRADGALLVRVPSRPSGGRLPDAVFSFRVGDPQYSFWAEMLAEQEAGQQ